MDNQLNFWTIVGAILFAGIPSSVANYFIWKKINGAVAILASLTAFLASLVGGLLFAIPLTICSALVKIAVEKSEKSV
jgi:hypothetical protein